MNRLPVLLKMKLHGDPHAHQWTYQQSQKSFLKVTFLMGINYEHEGQKGFHEHLNKIIELSEK